MRAIYANIHDMVFPDLIVKRLWLGNGRGHLCAWFFAGVVGYEGEVQQEGCVRC